MQVDLAILEPLVFAYLCVFFRIASVFVIGIPFGYHSAIPTRIKVFFLVHLSAGVFFTGLSFSGPGPASIADPLVMFVILTQEVALGVALGMIVRMALWAAEGFATLVSTAMGLGFAVSVDPGTGVQTTAIGRFAAMIAVLIMLAIDAHLAVFEVVFVSFEAYPAGQALWVAPAGKSIAMLGNEFLHASLRMAAPVVAFGLVAYLVLAVITKVAPQLNLFAVGFPVLIIGGLMLFGLTMVDAALILQDDFQGLRTRLLRFLATGALQ